MLKPNTDPKVLGRVMVRWVRDATNGSEFQAVADGRAMADPLWTVSELRKLADAIERRGGFDFMADIDEHGRPMGSITSTPKIGAVRQGPRPAQSHVLRPKESG